MKSVLLLVSLMQNGSIKRPIVYNGIRSLSASLNHQKQYSISDHSEVKKAEQALRLFMIEGLSKKVSQLKHLVGEKEKELFKVQKEQNRYEADLHALKENMPVEFSYGLFMRQHPSDPDHMQFTQLIHNHHLAKKKAGDEILMSIKEYQEIGTPLCKHEVVNQE